MLATGGSRARGRRPGAVVAAMGVVAATLAFTVAPATAVTVPNATATASDAVTLAVVVPITAPADAVGLISAASLAEYTAVTPAGLLTRQLDAVAGTGAILAIDPMILASIRVLGSAAPASARAWLARLDAAPNERIALPYADADPTLFTQSIAGTLPTTGGFSFAIDPANFLAPVESADPTASPAPSAPATPTPSPTLDPDLPPVIPTAEEVVVVHGATTGISWPRAGTVGASDLVALGADAFILSDVDVERAAVVGGVATVEDHRALVIAGDVAAAITTAARTTDETAWLAAVDAARVAIAARAAQSGTAGTVVVGLDRLAAADAARLPETLALLTADGAVQLSGLPALLSAAHPAPDAALLPGAQDPERLATINGRLGAEGAAARFATAVADPALVNDPARLRTLALGGEAWIGRSDWASVVASSIVDVEGLLASVRIVDATFQFFADRSMLPISIQNDGAQPVTVLVTARPGTGLLDIDDESVELVVPAASQATVEFAATAVSNGTVDVTVSMTSTAGVPIGTSTIANVNVQAGWETPIVAAAAVAVGALLIFGVIRTVRRVRATRRESTDVDTDRTDG